MGSKGVKVGRNEDVGLGAELTMTLLCLWRSMVFGLEETT